MQRATNTPGGGEESLSPLEQEVLDEYIKLAGNLGTVSLLFLISRSSSFHRMFFGGDLACILCGVYPCLELPRYLYTSCDFVVLLFYVLLIVLTFLITFPILRTRVASGTTIYHIQLTNIPSLSHQKSPTTSPFR